MRLFSAALFITLFFTALPVFAQSPAPSNAEAEKLVDALDLINTIKAQTDMFASNIIKDKGKSMPPAVQQKMEPIVKEELRNSISRNQPELRQDVAAVVAKNFTVAELKEVNAFAATPTGQKLVKIWPVMQPEMEALSKKWSQRIQMDVMANVMTRMTMGK